MPRTMLVAVEYVRQCKTLTVQQWRCTSDYFSLENSAGKNQEARCNNNFSIIMKIQAIIKDKTRASSSVANRYRML